MKIQISVVIQIYNRQDIISHALDSVLKQTVLPFEIIVVNDVSTDGFQYVMQK